VLSLVRGFVGRDVEVDLFGPAAAEQLFGFSQAGARFTAAEIGTGFSGVGLLRRVLRTEPVDVIHAHGLRAGLAASLARPAGTPLVVTWHTSLPGAGVRRTTDRALARTVVRAADLTFGVTDDLVAEATMLGAREARPCLVSAPALPAPARNRAEVLAEFDLELQTPVILAVGRLHPGKRFDVLIEAAARWRWLVPKPAVLIAGIGPAYRGLAAKASLSRAPVLLVGYRADVADLLNAADIAVVTSESEARTLFVQEALAAGTALVATAVGGVPDLVGDAAVLVPAGDVDALDAAVRELLADPEARKRYAVAGRARAAAWPSEAEIVGQVLSAYTELTGRSEAVPP
jgi:glycosyltransferase involved in cell wall biosynthesis